MPPTGAAKADGEIALAFANVVRQQIDEQLRDAFNEFAALRERTHILCNLGMATGKGPQLRHEVRIRQKADVEEQVAILRNAVLVSEADAGDGDGGVRIAEA